MNRNKMIKWLSENTTREQWVVDSMLLYYSNLCLSVCGEWDTYNTENQDGVYVKYIGGGQPQRDITIDDVFEPEFKFVEYGVYRIGLDNAKHEDYTYNPAVKKFEKYPNGPYLTCDFVCPSNKRITYFKPVREQPVYIDGGIYEIGVMNGEPQQFVYNVKLNMFERGSNESIGASSVHGSTVVTHFKLVSKPERITDRDAIDTIPREEATEFMDSSVVTSEPQGLLNHRREPSSAVKILNDAAECIGDRAAERDTDDERSMLSTVNAFNAMYGTELTETQGWMFLVFLKASRAKQGDFREDDYTDGAAYFALAGECDGNVRR